MRASLTAMTGQASRPSASSPRSRTRPGRRLLGPADEPVEQLRPRRVQHGEQVGAVVERDVRGAVDDRDDARRVGVGVLAAPAVRGAAVRDERGDDVVLRAERVGGGHGDLRAAGGERPHEARRLGGHVQARADAQPVERPLGREALAQRAQDGHLLVRPGDAGLALAGQAHIEGTPAVIRTAV